jgi:hypothetical protein
MNPVTIARTLAVCVVLASAQGCRQEISETLYYEFAPAEGDGEEKIDVDAWRRSVDHRINVDGQAARVTVTEDDRYEIGVFPNKSIERIRWRLEHQGDVEMRILAHPAVHAAIANTARSIDEGVVVNEAGNPLAKWVPILMDDAGQPWIEIPEDQAVIRTGPEGQQEVLVVIDDKNIDEQDIVKLMFSTDESGRHAIRYYLSAPAAIELQKLTQANLPTEGLPQVRLMGYILDGKLWSVTPLNEELADSGFITGDFTPEMVRNMLAVYGYNNYDRIQPGGRLPAPLVPVEPENKNPQTEEEE